MSVVFALLLGLGVFLVFDACTSPAAGRDRRRSTGYRTGAGGLAGRGWPRQRLAGAVRDRVPGLRRRRGGGGDRPARIDRRSRWSAFVAGVYAPVGYYRSRRRVARRARQQCWPEAIELLAGAVRAGDTLPSAVARGLERGPAPLRPRVPSRRRGPSRLGRLRRRARTARSRARGSDRGSGRRDARDRAPGRRPGARSGVAHARWVPARGPRGPQGDRRPAVLDAWSRLASRPRRRGWCSSWSRAGRRARRPTTRSPGCWCSSVGAAATARRVPADGRARAAARRSRGCWSASTRRRRPGRRERRCGRWSSSGSGCSGVTVLISCLPRFRRPSLVAATHAVPRRARTPTVAAPRDRRTSHGPACSARSSPCSRTWARGLQRLFGDDGRDLPARLAAAGSTLTPRASGPSRRPGAVGGFIGGVVLTRRARGREWAQHLAGRRGAASRSRSARSEWSGVTDR